MAVSLVSTGIQFPDSTIQTTAATGSSPKWIFISNSAASGGTAVEIQLSSSYLVYKIFYTGFYTNSNGALECQFSADSGASYYTTGYQWGTIGGNPVTAQSTSGQASGRICEGNINSGNQPSTGVYGELTIYPGNSTDFNRPTLGGFSVPFNGGRVPFFAGVTLATNTTINRIKFIMNTSVGMFGNFSLYGISNV
jgi:hypothetical protein